MKELARLVPVYLEHFHKEGEKSLPFFIKSSVPSLVFLIEYKKLPPIETLPEKEKNDLWEYAKEIYPEGTQEERLKAVKIVYTIGTLL